MILRELRTGDFSHLGERVQRIEQLINGGMLPANEERRLRLLAAKFLEGAGDTRRALRLTGGLLSDRETLQGSFYLDLRRFRIRLCLNLGDLDSARWEIDRTERIVTETSEGFGAIKEVVDSADVSVVSTPTWLLEAEVCLAEGKAEDALRCLANAVRCMQDGSTNVDEMAMCELLSAVAFAAVGDDAAAPALAYLYRVNVLGDSSLDAAVRGRIAAAVGDLERVVGISQAEAHRWRRYGPRVELLGRYLDDATLPMIDLSARLPLMEIETVVPSAPRRIERPVEEPVGLVDAGSFPMSFQFSAHGLEDVSGYFDFHLKTGPVIVDWSRCDESLIDDAIEAGAITPLARAHKSGIIYFNNGAYVDAVFEGDEREGLLVEDLIYELFRISMAVLPGTFGCNAAAGSTAARDPEVVNLRPNKLNLDLMRRLDHARIGGILPEIDEVDIDQALASWGDASVEDTRVEVSRESVGVSDVEVEQSAPFVGGLLKLSEADSLGAIYEHGKSLVSALGVEQGVLTIKSSRSLKPFLEAVALPSDYGVIAKCNGGPVLVEFCLPSSVDVSCKEALQLVLNAVGQRIRTIGAVVVEGKVDVPDFVAEDLVTQSLLSNLRDFAMLDGTVRPAKSILLRGERGTGKELLARAIHSWSSRSDKAFKAANFGMFSKELGASQIFGARKGAYTGADRDSKGHIQEAEGGTLFLDELDEADDAVQAMLKRVIQFGTYHQVGSPDELRANVRFVAATNVVGVESGIKLDLRDRFLEVRVPALRERRADIRPLASLFGSQAGFVLPDTVLAFLETLDWPGNVRQLQTVVERACAVVQPDSAAELTLDLFEWSAIEEHALNLGAEIKSEFAPLAIGETLKMRREKVDSYHIKRVLEECKGNTKHAATRLGMTGPGLRDKMKGLGISAESARLS